ncbi:MAG: hypothetical protein M3O22_06120 [Pseudomonadota bacterium]|nr:hypothetical protein [Pseudomonadota bacterium]
MPAISDAYITINALAKICMTCLDAVILRRDFLSPAGQKWFDADDLSPFPDNKSDAVLKFLGQEAERLKKAFAAREAMLGSATIKNGNLVFSCKSPGESDEDCYWRRLATTLGRTITETRQLVNGAVRSGQSYEAPPKIASFELFPLW